MCFDIPDHPDIRAAERTGYPCGYKSIELVGHCMFCCEDIPEGRRYVESFDGIFCDMECCHEYYEIEEK